MQNQVFQKIIKIVCFMFVLSYLSFFSGIKLAFAVNTSTADDDDARILLEAAHGSGYTKNGWDECNHASNSVDGKTYYENLEARIMIDKIAGYLKQANIPYEISNETVGDSYFTTGYNGNCNPNGDGCCGFRQGTIGNYSSTLYEKIDRIGADKYLFAFELHFNAYDGTATYSAVMLDSVTEPYSTNGRKLVNAVDKVIGTSDSKVVRDVDLFGDLTAINNLQSARGIPTYYLETFFMDYTPHLKVYINKKDELAKEIAQVLVEMAGSSERLDDINYDNNDDDDDEELTGGRTDDPFSSYPTLISSNELTCKAILVDINTGELNNLGKLLQDIFNLMKIIAPAIAIALSLIDFLKTFAAKNPTAERDKAIKRTIKRIGIAIILVFLPYLLDLLFHLFGLYDINSCNIK